MEIQILFLEHQKKAFQDFKKITLVNEIVYTLPVQLIMKVKKC